MPNYIYIHPKTGEQFQQIRSIDNRDDPFYAPDGIQCKRGITSHLSIIDKNCEVWNKDNAYVQRCNPKFVVTRSGKKIKYNRSSMGGVDGTLTHSINSMGLPKFGKEGQQVFINNKWYKWERDKWIFIDENNKK